MSKIAVVYWSGTGNTEQMASAILEGAKEKGADAVLFETSAFDASMMDDYDAVAFGCPAMGDEVLEEDEFQPMFDSCEAKRSGKKIKTTDAVKRKENRRNSKRVLLFFTYQAIPAAFPGYPRWRRLQPASFPPNCHSPRRHQWWESRGRRRR